MTNRSFSRYLTIGVLAAGLLVQAIPALAQNAAQDQCPVGTQPVYTTSPSGIQELSSCQPFSAGQTGAPAPASNPGVPKQAFTSPTGLTLQIGKSPACLSEGNCSLDDIVFTAASFANLLSIIAGALFLVAFVYGGSAYLLSRGQAKWIDAGKKAMTNATIGMVIIMCSYVITNFVMTAIIAKK